MNEEQFQHTPEPPKQFSAKFAPPHLEASQPVPLEYAGRGSSEITIRSHSAFFAKASIALFLFSVAPLLFVMGSAVGPQTTGGWGESAVSLGIALLGATSGVISLRRLERLRALAAAGVFLNSIWFIGFGCLTALAFSIFGGVSGSDLH